MTAFFKTHVCNEACLLLNLKPVNIMDKSSGIFFSNLLYFVLHDAYIKSTAPVYYVQYCSLLEYLRM